jgi:hypothetical protein
MTSDDVIDSNSTRSGAPLHLVAAGSLVAGEAVVRNERFVSAKVRLRIE